METPRLSNTEQEMAIMVALVTGLRTCGGEGIDRRYKWVDGQMEQQWGGEYGKRACAEAGW